MVLPMTLNRYSEGFSSYAFSIAYEDVWRPEVRRLTLIRLYAVIKRAREAGLRLAADPPLMVIKEVNGSHGADLVMSLFPRSKMIFLARDGRDVLDSLLDANKEGGWMTKGTAGTMPYSNEEERRDFVRESSLGWAARTHVCNVAYERHDPELRRKIRYEDLLADTEANFTDLASWLELPGGPKRIENIVKAHSFERVPEDRRGPGKIRRTATPGAWREGLSPEDQEVAQEIMGGGLATLGYETWLGCSVGLRRDRRSPVRRRGARVQARLDLGIPSDRQHLAPRDALQSARVEALRAIGLLVARGLHRPGSGTRRGRVPDLLAPRTAFRGTRGGLR